jgi:cell division septum initiation protein DivIVA
VGRSDIDQREINVELPRALFGGLKRRPTEELLRCVARDYAELELENRKLRSQLEDLRSARSRTEAGEVAVAGPGVELEVAPSVSSQAPASPGAELEATSITSLEPVAAPVPAKTPAPPARLVRLRPREPNEADALARSLLLLAERSARETRESTRRECELMLKKARQQALSFGKELERQTASTAAELRELQRLRQELREGMRASLTAIIRACGEDGNGVFPLDLSGEFGDYSRVEARPYKVKKKSKS